MTVGAGYLAGAPAAVPVADDDATTVTLTVPDSYADKRDARDTAELVLTVNRGLREGERLAIPLAFDGGDAGTDFNLAFATGPGFSTRGINLIGTTLIYTGTRTGTTSTRTTLRLTALEDADEKDDTVTVSIPSSDNGNAPILTATGLDGGARGVRTGNGQIVLGELQHTVSVSVAADAPEGDTGTTLKEVTFDVTPERAAGNAFHLDICLTGTADEGSTGDYRITDRGGTPGSEWAVRPDGCMYIGSNETLAYWMGRFFIRVNGDTDVEDDETVTLTLKRRAGGAHATPGDVVISGTAGSATYTIQNDDAAHAVLLTPTALSVRENDGTETYSIRLRSAPGGTVTVTVTPTSGDPAKAAVSSPVSFDNTDWQTPKPVTVTGKGAVDDTATITHAVTTGTTDYPTTLAVGSVEVTLTADTRPVVSLTTSSGASVAEGDTVPDGLGGTTQEWVALNLTTADTLAADLDVSVTVTQTGNIARQGDVGARTETLPRSSGNRNATIDIDDDGVDEPNGSVTATLNPGADYRVSATDSTFTTVLVDDDPTTVTLARAGSGAIAEGDTATLTVTLGRNLVAGESVTVPLAVSGTGITATDYTLTRPTSGGLNKGVTLLTTNPHSAAHPAVAFAGHATDTVRVATLTLTALVDSTAEDSSETLAVGFGTGARAVTSTLDRATGTGAGGTTPTGTASVEIAADATPGLVLAPAKLDVAEGASGTFTVALQTQPTAAVTVTVASDNGDVTVDTDTGTDDSQRTLTFNPTGAKLWSTAQTVTVTAREDTDLADEGATVTLAASGGDYGAVSATLEVAVRDTDAPEVSLAPILNTAELPEGTSIQINFVLSRALEADETASYRFAFGGTATRGTDYRLRCVGDAGRNAGITCANLDSGVATVTFDGAQLTNHRFALFELDLLEDDMAEAKETATLRLGGGRSSTMTVGIVDAPSTTTISFVLEDFQVREGNGPAQPTVRMTPRFGKDIEVPVTVTGTATPDVDYAAFSTMTFPASYRIASFTFKEVDDKVAEGDETIIIAMDTANLPPGVTAGSITTATVTILDNDQTGLILTPSSLEVSEGASGTFTVRLRSEPTADVTVTVSGHSGTDAAVDTDVGASGDQDTLTFTPATWNEAQTVTVRTSADDEAVSLALAAAGGGYDGVSATLAVAVKEYVIPEAPSLSVSDTAGSESADPAQVRFTVSLVPASDEAVKATAYTRESLPVSARRGSDYKWTSATLTFAPGEPEKHVAVPVVRDTESEGPETFELVLASRGPPFLDGVGVGTITDTPPPPGVTVSRKVLALDEGGTAGSYSVALHAPPGTGETVTVTAAVADPGPRGCARAGAPWARTSRSPSPPLTGRSRRR